MPLATKTRRPVKAARASLAAATPAPAPVDPCAKCRTVGGIWHIASCVKCLPHNVATSPGGRSRIPGAGATGILGKLPRYLEVAGGGAIIVAGLVVLVVSATGGTPKVPGVATLGRLRTKSEPSESRNVRYAARRRAETASVDTTAERTRTARLSAAESLAVRRAQDARRARAEAKLTESYLPERRAGLRRTGQVERPRGRSPVASRPVRSQA